MADRALLRAARATWALMILLAATAAAPAAAIELDVSFSSRKDGELPEKTLETEFTCSDTIYIIIESDDLAEGVRQIEIHWMDPRGGRQELTRFPAYSDGGHTLLWAWLRLHAPENSGIVRTFDPSHGMRDFIGTWTIKIIVDDHYVGSGNFEVLC